MASNGKKGRFKEHTLLEPTERAQLKKWGGTGWMSSPRRILARRRAMRTIDRLVEAQRSANAPWAEAPKVLARLLAVSLRADGSVVDYFDSRGASDLQTDEEWEKFFWLFAQAHVEQWLEQRDKDGKEPEAPGLVVEGDYLDSLQDLLALAKQEGQRNQEEARKEEQAKTFNMAQISDLTKETRERLHAYLEESDIFAHEAEGADIPEDEQEREIETAALSRLKLADLEQLAVEKGLPIVASKEGLAELIVRRADITREEIAELALRGTEVSIDTGLITRLFPLVERPDIAAAAARLARVQGRYVKLRLARWFIYDDSAAAAGSTLVLRGRIRSYRTKPVLEVEGHRLNADPHSAKMVVRLRERRQWAEVDGRQLTDARDISTVMARGAGVRFNPALALPLPALSEVLGAWNRQTVWMLAFLQLHLEGDGIAIHNYSMAHFEAADASTPVRPDEPRIAEVQLRGQHVGSSRDACQRIIDGGGLLAIELMLSFVPNQNDSYLVPVRIGVDDGCATVQTGAGKKIPAAVSSSLHGALIDRVRRALEIKLDPKALNGLVDKIIDRARAREPAQHADMFAPELNVSGSGQPEGK